jgi:protein phosphatase
MSLLDQTDFLTIFSVYESQFLLEVDKFSARRLRLRLPFVSSSVLSRLFSQIHSVFKTEPTLHFLTGDFTIVGNLNGSILDLLRIFHTQGSPQDFNYLFLGNLVNSGEFSIQVITLIFLAKILFPTRVYVLRGCEEFSDCCETCGLRNELETLYGSHNSLYRELLSIFSELPLAAVLNGRYFCASGGIGPSITELAQISAIQRPISVLPPTMVLELCWSEPTNVLPRFLPSSRGIGTLFGVEAVENFLKAIGLELLIRSRSIVNTGCEFSLNGKVLTVFSNSQKNSQTGITIVRGNGVEEIRWKAYVQLKRTDVTFLTSCDPTHFVVQHNLSTIAGQCLTPRDSVPMCEGLRLTTSKIGMARPIYTAVPIKLNPVMGVPGRKIVMPVVKRITFSFSEHE